MKHRLARVNEVLKRELGELLVRHCRFQSQLVTVQEVDVTPDLKHAHVFISIIGPTADQHHDMAQLHGLRIDLQRELAKRVVLKFTPLLHFKLDDVAERGDRVLQLLSEIEVPEDESGDEMESAP